MHNNGNKNNIVILAFEHFSSIQHKATHIALERCP
jgi:hypothetical protein